MARLDLLLNAALTTPFQAYRGNNKLKTAVGWLPWWQKADADDPDWKNRQPVFDAYTIDEGVVQLVSTPWGTHIAGVWQQVPSAVGNQYEFTIEGQAWSSEDAAPATQLEASDVNLQIGIDPTGGSDPESPLIVWSQKSQPLSRWQTLRLNIQAEAAIITIYLKSAPTLPKRQQAIFWRNAHLRPIGQHKRGVNIVGAGDTHIRTQPDRPSPMSAVEVTISSTRPHQFVDLQVQHAGKTITAVFQNSTQDEERTFWHYTFTPRENGLHEIRFVGDGGGRLLALRLLQVARDVQLVPSNIPRETYKRVYVLLPPTADLSWLQAAAEGSFHGRFTIGFSADDAGLGDLKQRHVVAVNPHHWPEILTDAWFQQHYPGVRFTAVVANAPQDLKSWLQTWIDY